MNSLRISWVNPLKILYGVVVRIWVPLEPRPRWAVSGVGVRSFLYISPTPLHYTAICCSAVKKNAIPVNEINIYECGPTKLCYCLTHFAHLFLTVRITSIL